MPGGWWLVTWSLHGPKCVLPTLMILIQFPSGLVGIIRNPLPTSQTSTKQSGLGFLFQERPDEELCSLKVEGVSHRVAAPGIGVWMLGSVVKDLWILPQMHPTTPVKGALRQASLAKEPSLWCDASIVDFRHCHWLRPHSKAQPGRKEWNLDEGKRVKNERTLYHYMTINNFDQSVVGIHVWFPLRSGWIKGLQRLFLTCRNWFSVQDIQFICSIGPWFGMRSLAMSCFSMAVTFILVRILTWLPLCRRRSEKWTANDAEICSKISLLRKGARQEHNEDGFLNAFSVCFYCTYGDDTVALILCPVSWTQGIPRLRNFRWQMF